MTITITLQGLAMSHLTVSGVARLISDQTGCTVAPHVISNLFYKRHLDDDRCPVVGRIRLIPADYMPVIVAELQRRGQLQQEIEEAE